LEEIRQPLFRFEAELKRDVRDGIVVVVDVDLVEDLGIEREPIGPVRGFEQRVDAEDKRHARQRVPVVAAKRIYVGDIGLVVEGGDGRFAMVGREGRQGSG
jgi:hypothetical protein